MRSGQDLIWSPKLPPAAAKFAIFFVSTAIPYSLNLPLPSKILAGAEGFEPPSSVLETDSLTVELTPLCPCGADALARVPLLFYFFVRRMLPATVTEFLHFQPVRRSLPVLGGRIVSLFAVTALQRNNFSGHENSS